MVDLRAGRAIHHVNRRQNAAGQWEVARPLRHSSWWFRRKHERECRKAHGHCWHPERNSLTFWWCCLCSGETEGMPDQNCKYCNENHECSEIGNALGGYDCICGEPWLDSFGGCFNAPKEQIAKNKAAWDAGQTRRAERLMGIKAVTGDGQGH
ncbi:MAG TPA: hypothetical protein DGT23_32375 [Micromonosporaceae bacterium]|nr:hypothetical protein [Micromonosporaceae bacterium]